MHTAEEVLVDLLAVVLGDKPGESASYRHIERQTYIVASSWR